jgi:hypothetical protein
MSWYKVFGPDVQLESDAREARSRGRKAYVSRKVEDDGRPISHDELLSRCRMFLQSMSGSRELTPCELAITEKEIADCAENKEVQK